MLLKKEFHQPRPQALDIILSIRPKNSKKSLKILSLHRKK